MGGIRIVGLAVALLASTSAAAATYFATITGSVTGMTAGMDPEATGAVRVGDTITATLRYTVDPNAGDGPSGRIDMFGINKAVFTIGGRSWTSDADHLGMDAPPQFQLGADPLGSYVSIMEGKDAGDLRVRGYSFTIDDFGYGAYFGPIFQGSFDPATLVTSSDQPVEISSAVPELTLWAQMIAGFAVIGTAIRRRAARRAKWLGLVSRLSGRVREA